MIAVLDYGMGNVCSIVNMLKKIGVPAVLTGDPHLVLQAEKLILPGVGAFDCGMQKLRENGLADAVLHHATTLSKPLLGICLGMQMLGRKSEEGSEPGLGLIPFDNKRFVIPPETGLKIPHMGWDVVTVNQPQDPLVQNLCEEPRYYFVHSYHAVCDSQNDVLMTCDYGYPFAAAVKRGNVTGTQFHPEKSHKFGMALLQNFAGVV